MARGGESSSPLVVSLQAKKERNARIFGYVGKSYYLCTLKVLDKKV